MKKKLGKHKLHRKYKRYAAAVAGAAILAGSALPGVPAAKVLAAENPVPSAQIQQTTTATPDTPKPDVQEQQRDRDQNRDQDQNRDRDQNNDRDWQRDRDRDNYRDGDRHWWNQRVFSASDPVDIVKAVASVYGFDAMQDTFSTISLTSRDASVIITKHDTGERFRVDLTRSYFHDWNIAALYSIGY